MQTNDDIEDNDSDNDLLSALIDEISLEGLDGITLPSLWIRLLVRYETNIGKPGKTFDFESDSVQNFIFEYLIKSLTNDKTVSMYSLPENRQTISLYNRYDFVNKETGTLLEDPDLIPDDIYGEVNPISDQKIRGSSLDYYKRTNVTKNVMENKMSVSDIQNNFGLEKFVLVSDQNQRSMTLFGPYSPPDIELTPIQYCILERVGRQRFLGEITVGKESGNYKLSPKTLFYYRKLLLKKSLIKKKQCIVFNSKTAQNSHGLVFTLNRFTTEKQTISEINAKKISDLLLKSENKELDYEEVKTHLEIKAKYLRDLLHSYSSNFRVYDSSQEASSSSNKSHYKRCIRLLKPIGVEDIDETELNEDNDDDEEITINGNKNQSLNIFSAGKILADRTLLAQTLAVIESHESQEGIPSKEVERCLSLPKLETRSLLRALEKLDVISTVLMDRGRQKVTLYIPKWRTQPINGGLNRTPSPKGLTESNTNFLNRANIILDFVKKEQLVDRIFTLKQLIRESEKNNEHKVCTKTVVRIVHKLAAEGLIRSIRTFLKYQDRMKKLHFVCIPSITVEHPLVKDKINQIKFQWIGHNIIDIQSDKQQPVFDKSNNTLSEKWTKNNVLMNLVYQPSIARKYGLEPKMKKILTLYRFLFYLTHDFDKQNIPNTDWRYNIEPLAERPQSNVCQIGQIIPRLPLSVFVKIVWISHIIPGLQELLDDPIKVNLTLSQISPIILECLRYKRKYVFNICEALVGLTYMDLVETQYKEQTEKEKTTIIVKNKFSLIVNKIQTNFEINSMKDLQDFEEALQMHCFEPCTDCSLDKRLFAHNLRNWTYTPSYKSKSVLSTNRLQTISGNNESIDNTVDKQKENRKKRKQNNSSNHSKNAKKLKTNEMIVTNINTESVANERSNAVQQKKRKNRKKPYDKIDLKAKSLLKKQRTDWTPEEDSFLLICKVVSTLLDPHCSHHICVNRNVIRDELHKYYPKVSADKTALACGRRITYMLKNPTTRQNVFDYIGEFKQQISISRPNVPKTKEQIWNETYVILLHDILNRMQSSHQKNNDNNRTIITVNSLGELLSRFNIVKTPSSVLPTRGRLHEDANNVVDIHVNIVTNVLLSSLLSKLYLSSNNSKTDSTLFSQTLFRIYQRFPDSLIRSVVTKLNRYGVMTKVKKTTKETLSSLKTKGNTPYRISQNFLFLMQTKYCLETLLMEYKLNEDFICIKDGKTGFEAAVVSSLLASKSVRFQTEIPDNIVVMQNDCPLFTTARNAVKNPKDPKTTSRYALHLLRQHMKSNPSDRIQHSADYLNVNQCRITCSATHPFILNINNFENLFKIQRELFTNELSSNQIRYSSPEDKQVFDFIALKRELGVSVEELLLLRTKDSLIQSLMRLNEQKLVYRVGIRNFRWVSVDYINPWLVRSQLSAESDKNIINSDQNSVKFFARYWKQPNGSIDVKVVFKFLSAVLGHIMTNPCIPEEKLLEYFDQSLQPVQLMEVIEMLISSQCIQVYESPKISEPKLFDSKPNLLNSQIKHYFSTPDSIIRLYRLKEYFKIK